MNPKERTEQLAREGGTIQIFDPHSTLTLAKVEWGDNRIKWCAIFPEHQGHVHEFEYNRVTLFNDGRDVAFYAGKKMVAYICPYEEGGLPLDDVREVLAEWQRLMSLPNIAEEFELFFEEAI